MAVLAALLAAGAVARAQTPQPLTVFAASSLTETMQQLGDDFTKATGVPVHISFAATSTLARQIEAGASVDVFVSADQAWMDQVDQHDLIDPATGTSLRRIPLGDDPEAFDLSPDGKTIYVSSEDDAAAVFIDAGSGKKLKEVKVGQEPEGVKVSADGKLLYVTSEVASLVHVIDTASGKVVKNIKVGKRPRRMAITPDGKELWVTCELDSGVTIVSIADNSVLATLKFEVKGARAQDITPVGIQMSRDGRRAFVALGRANHVAFVDVAARKVTDLVLVGKRAWNVALDKDEKRLFVVNGLSDDLSVIDVPAAKAIKTVPVGRVPYGVVVVE